MNVRVQNACWVVEQWAPAGQEPSQSWACCLLSLQALSKLLKPLGSVWTLFSEKNPTESTFCKMENSWRMKLGSPKMACFRHSWIQGLKQCHHNHLPAPT